MRSLQRDPASWKHEREKQQMTSTWDLIMDEGIMRNKRKLMCNHRNAQLENHSTVLGSGKSLSGEAGAHPSLHPASPPIRSP
jgi:hypothetical protein